MKKVKKSSLYISLLLIGTVLSGCGDVTHHYYSASKSHSSVTLIPTSIPGAPAGQVVFTDGSAIFDDNINHDLHYDIPLEEFGDSTNIYIGLTDVEGYFCILGEIDHFSVEYRIDIPTSLILYDANKDGYRDLCMTYEGLNSVEIYDVHNDKQLYYIADNNVTSDSYWLTLESNKLAIHVGPEVNPYMESDNTGYFSYSSTDGVYAYWDNYQKATKMSVSYMESSTGITGTVSDTQSVTTKKLTIKQKGRYYFWVKIEHPDTTSIVKNDIHIASRDRLIRIDTLGSNSDSEEYGFGYYLMFNFRNTNRTSDHTSVQFLCSGISMVLELYFE